MTEEKRKEENVNKKEGKNASAKSPEVPGFAFIPFHE